MYWRKTPRADLPHHALPVPRSNTIDRLPCPPTIPRELLAYSDSDWGSDASHRRSVTGSIILLSGAAVLYYTTKYQKAVALSSTEAEFVSASDTGKAAIYLRTILSDLGFAQTNPTRLLIDNTGAVFMVDAQAPTKRTRRVDIRYFALLNWSTTGQIKAKAIPTDANISDSLTKATGRVKFHQHADIFMGRSPPTYVPRILDRPLPVQRINTFVVLPISLETFSALHHQLISAYNMHPSDYDATEHGRVRGYRTRSTVATSYRRLLPYLSCTVVDWRALEHSHRIRYFYQMV